jgi:Flp pilus assembly protein TadG
MLLQYSNKTRTSSEENGAILILAAFIFAVALALVGLVTDVGNLYRTRTLLQNAADAASLSGVSYANSLKRSELYAEAGVIDSGDSPDSNETIRQKIQDLLIKKSRTIVRAHLEQSVVRPDLINDSNITGEYLEFNTGNVVFTFRVNIQTPVRHLLIDKVPMELFGAAKVADFTNLAVTALSKRNVANIAILIDASASMACPGEQTGQDCRCLTRDRDPGSLSCATPTKMDNTYDALAAFLERFDLKRDNLVVVPYNMKAEAVILKNYSAVIPQDLLTQSNVPRIIEILKTRFQPASSTNLCDALIESYKAMQTVAADQNAAYLLFSDGAPTAGRFFFTDPKNITSWVAYPGIVYDYTHFSITWATGTDDFIGPSVLVPSGMLQFGQSTIDANSIPVANRPTGANIPSCSPTTPPQVTNNNSSLSAATTAVFGNCLNSLASKTPDGQIFGGQYRPSGAKDFRDFAEQYYNCAIAWTDFIRRNKGTIHTIGYGLGANTGDSASRSNDDPLQNYRVSSKRKDYTLSRTANDYITAVAKPRMDGEDHFPNFPGFASYQDWHDGENGLDSYGRRQGNYLATPETSRLKELFEQIAQSIVLSLIE